jgi:hypothetical protein
MTKKQSRKATDDAAKEKYVTVRLGKLTSADKKELSGEREVREISSKIKEHAISREDQNDSIDLDFLSPDNLLYAPWELEKFDINKMLTAIITFKGDDQLFVSELSNYLALLQSIYRLKHAQMLVYLRHGQTSTRPRMGPEIDYEIEAEYRKNSFRDDFGASSQCQLEIVSIKKNSPLEITLCGVAVALAVAITISGGRFEFSWKGIKCRVPPIGDGIYKLRKALRKNSLK